MNPLTVGYGKMAAAIPTVEPEKVTRGDTVKWIISHGDYLAASGWTLSYALQKEGGDGPAITITGTASGNSHLVEVSAGDSQVWLPGTYQWQKYFTNSGGERYSSGGGRIEIADNFAGGADVDPRSRARRILDLIDANWEKLANKQVVASTVDGIQLQFRSIQELKLERDYWGTIVNQEEAALNKRRRGSIIGVFSSARQ